MFRIKFIILSLVLQLSAAMAQKMYVHQQSAYTPFDLSTEINFPSKLVVELGDKRFNIAAVDSISFTAPSPAYAFLPESAIERSTTAGRIYTTFSALQDAVKNKNNGVMRVGRWTVQSNGKYKFQYHQILSTVTVNLGTFATSHQVEKVAIQSLGKELIAYPFTYSTTQNIDWLANPNATGTCSFNTTKTSPYLTQCKSDVVVVQNIPSGTTSVVAHILPVKLSSGIAVTVFYDGGNYLTMTDASVTNDLNNSYKNYTVTFNESAASRKNNWMASIPSNTKFNMLSLPGTHDSATSGVGSTYSTMSQTQSMNIANQLAYGIRAFDLRPRYSSSSENDIKLANLEIYHGMVGTGVKWKDALSTIVNFVKNNPSETVLLNLKKENTESGNDYSDTWRASILESLNAYKDYLVAKITTNLTLGDCRGKVIILSRDGYSSSYNPVYGGLISWADNTTFDADIRVAGGSVATKARVEDHYDISTSNKQTYVKNLLAESSAHTDTKWYLCYTNVSWTTSDFFTSIKSKASTVNKGINTVIASGTYTGPLGAVMMDYAGSADQTGDQLVKNVIKQNYKYVYPF